MRRKIIHKSLERVLEKKVQISRVFPILDKELSDIVKVTSHVAAKKKAKEEKDTVTPKPAISFGYKFKGTVREAYALPRYESANIYNLHYGKDSAKPVSHAYEEGKNSTPEKEDDSKAMNPAQASETVQRIIYGVLFGSRSDISAEERERFANWRQFNKALRRFYEGEAHYFSSTTKAI